MPAARYAPQSALLAQLVEHFHGKEGVTGSSPVEGSRFSGSAPPHRLGARSRSVSCPVTDLLANLGKANCLVSDKEPDYGEDHSNRSKGWNGQGDGQQ